MRLTRNAVLAGLASLAMAGAAVAAEPGRHNVMNVVLADGSVARIAYTGDRPPLVLVDAAAPAEQWLAFDAPFAWLDRIALDMDRQFGALLRQIDLAAAAAPGMPGVDLAAASSLPAGTISYSMVATSDGRGTCSRSTRVTALGDGKPPKVETRLSGDCAGAGADDAPAPAARQAVAPAPAPEARPLKRT